VKHVIGLSGGKDSTALALRLMEIEPRDYELICNATGNELPEMVEHWAKLERMMGLPIKKVGHTTDLYGLIEQMQMLPNFRARWCTRILKIEPTIEYFESLAEGSILYVGLRADEEARRGIYGEDIKIRFPMREWGWNEADVWKYLGQRNVTIPRRTDCAVCPYQRLGECDYPAEYAKGVAVEEKLGHTFRSPQRDAWPASLKDLAVEFEKGRKIRGDGNAQTCRVCSL
jgi:3'-phosphoadenosine 5'-phosphosulfate sulfotransferase (PAPS reductase)/FAD synthetase